MGIELITPFPRLLFCPLLVSPLSSPLSTLLLSPPPCPLLPLSSPLPPLPFLPPSLSRYWAPGQPDNWGDDPGEDCGQVLGASYGMWNDERCTVPRRFICKVTNRESHRQDTGSLLYHQGPRWN